MVEFSSAELSAIRQFYESQLLETEAKLNHIKQVLEKLEGGVVVEAVPQVQKSKPKRKYKKKRGRKSIWGDFILKSLKKANRPLYYSEIIQLAKIEFAISEEKMKELKAAINQAAFRLRTVHGKVQTIGQSGKKEKQIVLSTWLNDQGELALPGQN